MSKPIILAVDDDAQVLAAVLRDLRPRYAEEYQILGAGSGSEALEAVGGVRERGRTIALYLVDQRMPSMTGTEFLLEAQTFFPDAKKVLLTAYADTAAAIQAINDVGLDHYLMKPWDPPEEKLYPILDDVLADWRAATPPPFDGVRVVGTTWSPATHEVKDFLARNEIPYRFLDIERDEEAAAMAAAATGGSSELPVVFLPEGTTLVRPDRRALAGEIGLHIEATGRSTIS
jgi:thioredoxin reductase (NADPH)